MNKKHDKILHTRVTKKLYEKISNRAQKHRLTISSLMRNIVEDYLEVQGDVLDAVNVKIKEYLNKQESIIGYQQIVLEKSTICQKCGVKMDKKNEAFIGFFENPAKRIIVCRECKDKK